MLTSELARSSHWEELCNTCGDEDDVVDCPACKNTGKTSYDGPIYLNVYLVDRLRGGPEEGGWYYDTGDPLESRALDPHEDVEAAKAAARKRWEEQGASRPRWSAIGGPDVEVYLEKHFARRFPERRPAYE